MSIYGYCRISTAKQSIDRQIRNIKAEYPTAHIVQEAYTGTSIFRPEWLKNGAAFNDPELGKQWHYINDGTVLNQPEDLEEGKTIPEFEEGSMPETMSTVELPGRNVQVILLSS